MPAGDLSLREALQSSRLARPGFHDVHYLTADRARSDLVRRESAMKVHPEQLRHVAEPESMQRADGVPGQVARSPSAPFLG
jgi:hypothetical protein